jgi:hypothetical protein
MEKDMRFGTWSIRILCWVGGLKSVTELQKYNLDLVGLQEVTWKGGYQLADNCTFFYGQENVNQHWGTGIFVRNRIISAVKRVEFISDRMSYITLKGRWCDITVPNMYAPTELLQRTRTDI